VSHEHRGPGADRAFAQMGVEHVAAQRSGVVGQVTVARPRGGDLAVTVHEAYPDETVTSERAGVDVEQTQFTQSPGREGVAARLVPGDRTLLDDDDVVARARQPGGDRRSGRTTADDEDVGVQSSCRQPADAADGGDPGMPTGPTGVMSAMAGTSGDVKS